MERRGNGSEWFDTNHTIEKKNREYIEKT
jgi:hypothetical protein